MSHQFTVGDLRAILATTSDEDRPVIFTFSGDTALHEEAVYANQDPESANFFVFDNPNNALEFHFDEELSDLESPADSALDEINKRSARGLEIWQYAQDSTPGTETRETYDLFNEIDSLSTPSNEQLFGEN